MASQKQKTKREKEAIEERLRVLSPQKMKECIVSFAQFYEKKQKAPIPKDTMNKLESQKGAKNVLRYIVMFDLYDHFLSFSRQGEDIRKQYQDLHQFCQEKQIQNYNEQKRQSIQEVVEQNYFQISKLKDELNKIIPGLCEMYEYFQKNSSNSSQRLTSHRRIGKQSEIAHQFKDEISYDQSSITTSQQQRARQPGYDPNIKKQGSRKQNKNHSSFVDFDNQNKAVVLNGFNKQESRSYLVQDEVDSENEVLELQNVENRICEQDENQNTTNTEDFEFPTSYSEDHSDLNEQEECPQNTGSNITQNSASYSMTILNKKRHQFESNFLDQDQNNSNSQTRKIVKRDISLNPTSQNSNENQQQKRIFYQNNGLKDKGEIIFDQVQQTMQKHSPCKINEKQSQREQKPIQGNQNIQINELVEFNSQQQYNISENLTNTTQCRINNTNNVTFSPINPIVNQGSLSSSDSNPIYSTNNLKKLFAIFFQLYTEGRDLKKIELFNSHLEEHNKLQIHIPNIYSQINRRVIELVGDIQNETKKKQLNVNKIPQSSCLNNLKFHEKEKNNNLIQLSEQCKNNMRQNEMLKSSSLSIDNKFSSSIPNTFLKPHQVQGNEFTLQKQSYNDPRNSVNTMVNKQMKQNEQTNLKNTENYNFQQFQLLTDKYLQKQPQSNYQQQLFQGQQQKQQQQQQQKFQIQLQQQQQSQKKQQLLLQQQQQQQQQQSYQNLNQKNQQIQEKQQKQQQQQQQEQNKIIGYNEKYQKDRQRNNQQILETNDPQNTSQISQQETNNLTQNQKTLLDTVNQQLHHNIFSQNQFTYQQVPNKQQQDSLQQQNYIQENQQIDSSTNYFDIYHKQHHHSILSSQKNNQNHTISSSTLSKNTNNLPKQININQNNSNTLSNKKCKQNKKKNQKPIEIILIDDDENNGEQKSEKNQNNQSHSEQFQPNQKLLNSEILLNEETNIIDLNSQMERKSMYLQDILQNSSSDIVRQPNQITSNQNIRKSSNSSFDMSADEEPYEKRVSTFSLKKKYHINNTSDKNDKFQTQNFNQLQQLEFNQMFIDDENNNKQTLDQACYFEQYNSDFQVQMNLNNNSETVDIVSTYLQNNNNQQLYSELNPIQEQQQTNTALSILPNLPSTNSNDDKQISPNQKINQQIFKHSNNDLQILALNNYTNEQNLQNKQKDNNQNKKQINNIDDQLFELSEQQNASKNLEQIFEILPNKNDLVNQIQTINSADNGSNYVSSSKQLECVKDNSQQQLDSTPPTMISEIPQDYSNSQNSLLIQNQENNISSESDTKNNIQEQLTHQTPKNKIMSCFYLLNQLLDLIIQVYQTDLQDDFETIIPEKQTIQLQQTDGQDKQIAELSFKEGNQLMENTFSDVKGSDEFIIKIQQIINQFPISNENLIQHESDISSKLIESLSNHNQDETILKQPVQVEQLDNSIEKQPNNDKNLSNNEQITDKDLEKYSKDNDSHIIDNSDNINENIILEENNKNLIINNIDDNVPIIQEIQINQESISKNINDESQLDSKQNNNENIEQENEKKKEKEEILLSAKDIEKINQNEENNNNGEENQIENERDNKIALNELTSKVRENKDQIYEYSLLGDINNPSNSILNQFELSPIFHDNLIINLQDNLFAHINNLTSLSDDLDQFHINDSKQEEQKYQQNSNQNQTKEEKINNEDEEDEGGNFFTKLIKNQKLEQQTRQDEDEKKQKNELMISKQEDEKSKIKGNIEDEEDYAKAQQSDTLPKKELTENNPNFIIEKVQLLDEESQLKRKKLLIKIFKSSKKYLKDKKLQSKQVLRGLFKLLKNNLHLFKSKQPKQKNKKIQKLKKSKKQKKLKNKSKSNQ